MTDFSIPIARLQEPVAVLTATTVGDTSAVANAGCVQIDLGSKQVVPRFSLQVKVTNNATAPGTGDSVTIFYAQSAENITDLTATGAPLSFEGNGETSLAVALQNTISAVHRHITAPIDVRARYLYVWYDITALAISAKVTISVELNWLG